MCSVTYVFIVVFLTILLLCDGFSSPTELLPQNLSSNTTRYNVLLNETSAAESARKKKNKSGKYTIPLLSAALLIKSIIFPLAFKAMAVMSAIAVVLSTMSLIISSIVGYAKLAIRSNQPSLKLIHKVPLFNNWEKDDENSMKNYYFEAVNVDPVQKISVPINEAYAER